MGKRNEAETRAKRVDPKLKRSGWGESEIEREHYFVKGRPFTAGRIYLVGEESRRREPQRADYVLRFRGQMIAVVEAKAESCSADAGLEQAKAYDVARHRDGPPPAIERVVSGGQTGVDRAALDAALSLGIACGGWCPRGRRAEDGPIPECYPLRETPAARYAQRTEWNVRDSDGTLVLHCGRLGRGTRLTLRLAAASERPLLVLDLSVGPDPAEVGLWAGACGVRVLNVAGPRESEAPGLYAETVRFLTEALRAANGRCGRATRLDGPPGLP